MVRASASDYRYVLGSLRGLEVSSQHEDIQPYQRDENNHALKSAASKGHESVIMFLLDHYDTLEISDEMVGDAFREASMIGHKNIVELFTTSQMTMTSHIDAALELSAFRGHLAIVNILLAYEGVSERITNRNSRVPQQIEPATSGGKEFSDQVRPLFPFDSIFRRNRKDSRLAQNVKFIFADADAEHD